MRRVVVHLRDKEGYIIAYRDREREEGVFV